MRHVIHHVRKHVTRVRSHPEHVRRRILHAATVVAGILLLFLWLWSLGRSVSDVGTRARVKRDIKPLSALKDNLVGGYINLTADPKSEEE